MRDRKMEKIALLLDSFNWSWFFHFDLWFCSFLHPADSKNPNLMLWLCKEEVRWYSRDSLLLSFFFVPYVYLLSSFWICLYYQFWFTSFLTSFLVLQLKTSSYCRLCLTCKKYKAIFLLERLWYQLKELTIFNFLFRSALLSYFLINIWNVIINKIKF